MPQYGKARMPLARVASAVQDRLPVEPAEVAAWSGGADVRLAWEIVFDAERVAPGRSDYADMIGDALFDHDNSRHRYLYDKYDAMAAV